MISILHPTRGRPQKSATTISKWLSNAKSDVEVIISVDKSDDTRHQYGIYYEPIQCKINVIINNNRSAVEAINNAAKKASRNIMIVVSDDTECPANWDKFLLQFVADRKDFIIKTSDGIQPYIITNPILDRAYYNRFGYIYNPGYTHMFCDLELTCVADLTGRKITSNILFKHNHYSVTKEPPDAISKRADGTWDQGEKLFLERYKRNFDLQPDQIKGKIQDNGMINWLQRKVRR